MNTTFPQQFKRIAVFTTLLVVMIVFLGKRSFQYQTFKKNLTEQVAECDDNDDDFDDLWFSTLAVVHFKIYNEEHSLVIINQVSTLKGKRLPKWMVFRQMKLGESMS